MSLVNKLAGLNDEPKLPVHYFYAALTELAAGEFTRAQIITMFGIEVSEEAELDAIIDGYTNATVARKQEYLEFIHRMFMLAEANAPGYITKADLDARLTRF